MRALVVILTWSMSIPFLCRAEQTTAGNPREKQAARAEAGARFGNKRDPFRSLIVPKRAVPKEAPSIAKARPPGLAGMLIPEIKLIGIASGVSARLAVLQGKDKATYFGKVGDRLYDGFISGIEADKVTFTEESVGTNGKKLQRTLTRKLYPET